MSGRTERGVSLFETTVALFLAGVMVLFMAPVFFRLVNDHRVVAYTNELVGALRFARAQALDQVAPVTLCSSLDGRHCTATPWTQGYIAFVDHGEPGVVDGEDQVLKVSSTRVLNVSARLQGADYVRFQRNGALVAAAPAFESPLERPTWVRALAALSPIAPAQAAVPSADAYASTAPATFVVCSGVLGRAINVTAVGQVRTETVECR
jgi:type IV fimbrial biogenesis protein FimT